MKIFMWRFCFCFLSLLEFNCAERLAAQAITAQVNSIVPNHTLELVNYKSKTANLSDFRGKILILDFWATWCAPCLKMMPKTDSLQKAFSGKIEFLPVTSDNREVIQKFIPSFEKSYNMGLYSAVNDSVLAKLFGVSGLPTYVWINSQGIYLGKSGPESITADKIAKLLSGKAPDFLNSTTRQLSFIESDQSVFDVRNRYDSSGSKPFGYSVFSKNLPGYILAIATRPPFMYVNVTIEHMYEAIFGMNDWYFENAQRVFWEVNDSNLFKYSMQAEIEASERSREEMHLLVDSTSFCYELKAFPGMSTKEQFKWMQSDINRYFGELLGIAGSREKRKIPCLVLVRTSNIDKIRDTVKRNEWDYMTVGDNLALWFKFKGYKGVPALEDGTGYAGAVHLELNTKNLRNIAEVNTELSKYDLKFIQEDRTVDVIVIRKRLSGSD